MAEAAGCRSHHELATCQALWLFTIVRAHPHFTVMLIHELHGSFQIEITMRFLDNMLGAVGGGGRPMDGEAVKPNVFKVMCDKKIGR